VVIHKNGMLEMSIINVIFLTNVEKCVIFLVTQLLLCNLFFDLAVRREFVHTHWIRIG